MVNQTAPTEASQKYAAAYAMHYTTKDIREAINLYRVIISAHPESQEAEYSRMQLQNIVHHIIPKKALLDAQVALILAHFERDGAI